MTEGPAAVRYFCWNVTTITWEVSEEQCPADLTMLVSEQQARYANNDGGKQEQKKIRLLPNKRMYGAGVPILEPGTRKERRSNKMGQTTHYFEMEPLEPDRQLREAATLTRTLLGSSQTAQSPTSRHASLLS